MTGAGDNALTVDWSAMSCLDVCKNLLNAVMVAQTQGKRVRVRYDNYEVEYKPEECTALIGLYNTMRAQCDDPAAAALPNLQPGKRVRRGPPIWGAVRR